jgi:uncharacterized protein YndB with AHSA1/START domain
MAQTDIIAPPGMQEVVVTRIINAPREVVFKTVTDPLLIPKWWGPRRLDTKVINMLVMPGGRWRFLQRDNEGKQYGFHGVYHEVLIPERLVYTSEFEGKPGHATLITDKFNERDGKTIITSTTIFQSVEDRDQMLQWGMEEGTIEMTDRLNELIVMREMKGRKEPLLAQKDENTGCITITRVFDAPRERVWERWTEPNQYMCWWGPKDFTSPYAKFDLRLGGKFLSCMRGPDGKDYWDTGTFVEISEPSHIVYTDSFADELGNVVPASYYGMGSDLPMEMAVEVKFEDIGGKTRLTLEHCGLPQGEMLDQSREGWNQSFDKLANCLE